MSDLSVSISSSGLVGLENEKPQTEHVNKAEQVDKTAQVEEVKKEPEAVTHEEVEVALVEVNAFVQSMQRNLSFTIDDQLGQEIISVTDAETKEVIRQIPSEELVVLRKKMDDVVGILFDTKV
ncbi:MAG: flagellar biosynthesis protein FlaG [Psychromonas sp.]|nr:flagellar biosynthesis protein FlaG [Alteromonadales bacterium]MCP5077656.1 flagellar biosynthesis protein FlaG [Psychromonas sp.]